MYSVNLQTYLTTAYPNTRKVKMRNFLSRLFDSFSRRIFDYSTYFANYHGKGYLHDILLHNCGLILSTRYAFTYKLCRNIFKILVNLHDYIYNDLHMVIQVLTVEVPRYTFIMTINLDNIWDTIIQIRYKILAFLIP
jgi:hypothetical protein